MIKRTLEEHPLPVLAGVVVATAGVTAGALIYFHGVEQTTAQERHRIELSETRQQLNARIDALKSYEAQLAMQIDDLQSQMLTIERKLGSDKELLSFDLADVVINEQALSRLRDSHYWVGNKDLGVRLPINYSWSHHNSNLLMLQSLNSFEPVHPLELLGPTQKLQTISLDLHFEQSMDSIEPILSSEDSTLRTMFDFLVNHEVGMWCADEVERHIIYSDGKARARSSLVPCISVQTVDQTFLSEMLRAATPLVEGMLSGMERGLQDILVDAPQAGDMDDLRGEQVDLDVNVTDVLSGIENLSLLVTSLIQVIQQNFFLQAGVLNAAEVDFQNQLHSFQKVENLTYLSSQLVLRDAIAVEGGTFEDLYIDKEVFIVGRVDDLIIIEVSIPSTHETTESFGNVHAWFGDLKIPVALRGL